MSLGSGDDPHRAVRAGFEAQARACEELGSPLTARLCRLFASRLQDDSATGARILSWPGETGAQGAAVALRLMGGLHRLVLTGAAPELARAYRAPEALEDAAWWQLLQTVLLRHDRVLEAGLASPPQTNEVRRSVALAAIGHWLATRSGLPLVISELGASAGLNLFWPDWRIETPAGAFGPDTAPVILTPDWRGSLPQPGRPQILAARGVDLAPPDPEVDRLRLLSYIWADQADRLARTGAALDHAARAPRRVAQGDAIDWLALRLAEPPRGALHLVCHTVAWQYFPQPAQARGEALLVEAGRRATAGAPLARFGMEADDSGLPGAALVLDLWPEGLRLPFGRADFHGRWIDWQPPADLSAGRPL